MASSKRPRKSASWPRRKCACGRLGSFGDRLLRAPPPPSPPARSRIIIWAASRWAAADSGGDLEGAREALARLVGLLRLDVDGAEDLVQLEVRPRPLARRLEPRHRLGDVARRGRARGRAPARPLGAPSSPRAACRRPARGARRPRRASPAWYWATPEDQRPRAGRTRRGPASARSRPAGLSWPRSARACSATAASRPRRPADAARHAAERRRSRARSAAPVIAARRSHFAVRPVPSVSVTIRSAARSLQALDDAARPAHDHRRRPGRAAEAEVDAQVVLRDVAAAARAPRPRAAPLADDAAHARADRAAVRPRCPRA